MPKLLAEFYEDFHHQVDASYTADNFLLDRDVRALQYVRGCRRVFELGCGTGRLLERTGAEVRCGTDLSPAAVAQARALGLDAQGHDIDDADLPYADASFDAALAIETLEHLFDPVHALAELNRVLVPGGRLCLTCPNIGYWVSRLALLTGRFTDFTGCGLHVTEHIRFYTVNSLTQLCRQAGFRVETVLGCAKLPAASPDDPRPARPGLRDVCRGGGTLRQRTETLIHALDRCLPAAWPAPARGLWLAAVKERAPEQRRNAAFDCFTTGFAYADHYRRG